MYNLTFDNPYNREIVRKLRQFRNKQQGYYVPTNMEPEHIVHQYDPITITGGSRASSAPAHYTADRPGALIHYPPDLFEPKYTINRNQMCGNRLKGGSSDLMRDPFQYPTNYLSGTSFDRKDKDINDLGYIHSKRRGQKGFVGGAAPIGLPKPIDIPKDTNKAVPIGKPKPFPKIPTDTNKAVPTNKLLAKLKQIKGGKRGKAKPETEKKSSSKLLKIFNGGYFEKARD